MNLPRKFRLSFYTNLALATGTLALAEIDQLPGLTAYFLVFGLVMLAAFLNQERWVMPRPVANVSALVIVLVWVLWSLQAGPGVTLEGEAVDWLRLLLPKFGPLLGILILAKLFLPKRSGDYWMIYALGLLKVVLACVLAVTNRMDRDQPLFAILLFLYAASGVWTLLLFNLYRDAISTVPARPGAGPPRSVASSNWSSLGFVRGISLHLMALLLGLLLFFAVPRYGQDGASSLFTPGPARAATGFNVAMDLTQTGPIDVGTEVVMRVEARDSSGSRIFLGEEQRWRGVTCVNYEKGLWTEHQSIAPQQDNTIGRDSPPGRKIRLEYYVDVSKIRPKRFLDQGRNISGSQPLFLAEPVYEPRGWPYFSGGQQENRDGSLRFSYRPMEMGLRAVIPRRYGFLVYEQLHVIPDVATGDWSREMDLTQGTNATPAWNYVRKLHELPLEKDNAQRIRAYANQVLAAAGVDTSITPSQEAQLPLEQQMRRYERKARVLSRHLSHSGLFQYTLDRQRSDPGLDPTEDFLLNTKQGHCELFASALALMLRSQYIPARVVIGFRGADWNSTDETHQIHQYHAHAWVEAFIGSRDTSDTPPTAGFDPRNCIFAGRWLSLDPTPGDGTAGAARPSAERHFWEDISQLAKFLWEFFILDYTGDAQRSRLLARLQSIEWFPKASFFIDLLDTIRQNVWTALEIVSAIAAVIVLLWLWRRTRRRRREQERALCAVPFYARLLRLLEQWPLRPTPGQTPREFCLQAADTLRATSDALHVSDVPARVVADFYQVRFGALPLEAAAESALNNDLQRLADVLAKRHS